MPVKEEIVKVANETVNEMIESKAIDPGAKSLAYCCAGAFAMGIIADRLLGNTVKKFWGFVTKPFRKDEEEAEEETENEKTE